MTIEDIDREVDPANYCPVCGGPTFYLGSLAGHNYFRCQNCGWEDSPAKD